MSKKCRRDNLQSKIVAETKCLGFYIGKWAKSDEEIISSQKAVSIRAQPKKALPSVLKNRSCMEYMEFARLETLHTEISDLYFLVLKIFEGEDLQNWHNKCSDFEVTFRKFPNKITLKSHWKGHWWNSKLCLHEAIQKKIIKHEEILLVANK